MKTPFYMKHAFPLLICAALLGTARLPAQETENKLGALTDNINIQGLETTYDPDTGIATAVGEVNIKYQGVEITAGRADYDTNTGLIVCKEDVVVVKEGQIFRSENMTYNVKTQDIKSNHILSGLGAIYYEANNLKTRTSQIERIDAVDAIFTTHDMDTPNYHMKARELTIYPGDRVVMHDAKFYVGNTPVFYLPYFVQPLDHELGYYWRVGYQTGWGVFLNQQYGVLYGDSTLAKYMLDLRSSRGVAGGVDFKSLRYKNDPNIGELLIYGAYDTKPATGVGGESRSGTDIPKSERYRVSFHHRIYLPGPDQSSWYMDFDINKFSDQYMLEDYYLKEFTTNPQPDNTLKLVKHTDSWVATLLFRMQLNDFFHTDTRQELAVDFTRTRLWNSNIYYEGSTSLGYYQDKLSTDEIATLNSKIQTQNAALKAFNNIGQPLLDATGKPVLDPKTGKPQVVSPSTTGVPALAGTTFTTNNVDILRAQQMNLLYSRSDVESDLNALNAELSENKFFRAHSYNEFLYPMSYGTNNWFNVVPRIGGGATYYSGIAGGTENFTSATQPLFHVGTDISGKFSKVYTEVDNPTWGLDQLRHVVEPYVNYSYLYAPPVSALPSIDRLAASTRPRPIDLASFTAIDNLATWNIARIGLRNLLQTKRDSAKIATVDNGGAAGSQNYGDPNSNNNGSTLDWMGFNTYADVFFKDPEHDRKISNLYNDFYWNPVPWLRVTQDTQLPLGSSDYNFTEINTAITWMPSKYISWTLGHQYLSHHPLFVDSSLLTSRVYLRVNDTWGFDMSHIYEIATGQLQFQSYSIHRDLTSWTSSFGVLVRQNSGAANDYGLILSFTLKAFPQVGLPLNIDPNPTGRGGSL